MTVHTNRASDHLTLEQVVRLPYRESRPLLRARRRKHRETARHQRIARHRANLTVI